MNIRKDDTDIELDAIDADDMHPDDIDAAFGEIAVEETVPHDIDNPEPVETLKLILGSDPRFPGGEVHLKYAPHIHNGVKIMMDMTGTTRDVTNRAFRLLYALHDPVKFEMYFHLPESERPKGVTMDLGTFEAERPSGHQILQNEKELRRRCIAAGISEEEITELTKIE
jgi:hypothetical protein